MISPLKPPLILGISWPRLTIPKVKTQCDNICAILGYESLLFLCKCVFWPTLRQEDIYWNSILNFSKSISIARWKSIGVYLDRSRAISVCFICNFWAQPFRYLIIEPNCWGCWKITKINNRFVDFVTAFLLRHCTFADNYNCVYIHIYILYIYVILCDYVCYRSPHDSWTI
jgi:hypothetical protein